MQEALMLFESISNSRWFTRTGLVLFLNKMDLFKTKLETSPISEYFPDYEGDCSNPDVACKFFQSKFLRLNRNPKKVITPSMPTIVILG
jgi:hypothetical protein